MPSQATPAPPRLSKSKYLSGLQCHKRLYLEIHSPELAGDVDEQTQGRLEMGIEVGRLARQCFPGGMLVDADRLGIPDALERTAALLADPAVPAIFEGLFEFDGVLARLDILERVSGDTWRIVEVKSSTKVKDEHLDDVAVQGYVLSGAGIHLKGVQLMHLNNGYLYLGGELDLGELFLREDVTKAAAGLQDQVPMRLAAMRKLLTAPSPPTIEPDHHCSQPVECLFWQHCTQDKPPRWVFHLPGGKKPFQELVSRGIQTIDEIPAGFKLTGIQQRMKDNVEWVGPGFKVVLATVRYPVHHLDFETFMPAIPKYPDTRPYQTIPFQWSNHVLARDGQVRHDAYLCTERKDPREKFAQTLLESVGEEGSVCVYSGYEKRILTELAACLPKLKARLDRVIERLWDLLAIIKGNYYHPEFAGSFSIKSVLPALVPALDYGDLEIREGSMASLQYFRMIFEVTDEAEKARIRTALLQYCERDTLAMVELRNALLSKAQ
jgi:hypothetical protein